MAIRFWLFFNKFVLDIYFFSFDENFKFLIPLTIILIPLFLGIFYGIVCYLFIIFKSKKIIISFLIFSLILGAMEFIRGTILTGFPGI